MMELNSVPPYLGPWATSAPPQNVPSAAKHFSPLFPHPETKKYFSSISPYFVIRNSSPVISSRLYCLPSSILITFSLEYPALQCFWTTQLVLVMFVSILPQWFPVKFYSIYNVATEEPSESQLLTAQHCIWYFTLKFTRVSICCCSANTWHTFTAFANTRLKPSMISSDNLVKTNNEVDMICYQNEN